MANILHLPLPPTRPPRPIHDSHAAALRIVATAFEVIAMHGDDDRLAEDFVEQIALTVLVWSEENLDDLDNDNNR